MEQQGELESEIYASYLQIYCETITDLLWQPCSSEASNTDTDAASSTNYSENQPLTLRERGDATGGVYVEGLSKYRVQSVEDLWELLCRGDANRSTAATNMNETSSRSHAVLILKIVTKDANHGANTSDSSNTNTTTPTTTTGYRESTLMLVDLAGSERASASEGRSALRQEEARAINLSLSALGNCMSALAAASSVSGGDGNNSNNKNVHIPYRDAKLTRLLQGCLGGGARTAVGE